MEVLGHRAAVNCRRLLFDREGHLLLGILLLRTRIKQITLLQIGCNIYSSLYSKNSLVTVWWVESRETRPRGGWWIGAGSRRAAGHVVEETRGDDEGRWRGAMTRGDEEGRWRGAMKRGDEEGRWRGAMTRGDEEVTWDHRTNGEGSLSEGEIIQTARDARRKDQRLKHQRDETGCIHLNQAVLTR